MTNSGDAAEQIVRMSLEGTEVALKLSGSAAKNIAAALYTIAKNADGNKTKGHQRLSAMLKSGKELKVFTISEEHLKRFAQEAKRYGVVYCALRGKEKSADGMVDVMVRAEDASKINRIVERFKLATVDTASIKHDIEKTRQEKESAPADPQKAAPQKAAPQKAAPQKAAPQKNADDMILEELLGAPIQKEQPSPENPTVAKTEKSPPSEPTSGTQRKTAEGTAKESRPSVREELREIKAARQEKAEAPKQQETARPNKQPLPTMNMHQNPGKKKPKVKAR